MNHGGTTADGQECQISMLFNFNTVGACFLSSGWYIRNEAMFAGTCIGVIVLVVVVELFRRAGKEYDDFLLHQFRRRAQAHAAAMAALSEDGFESDAAPRSGSLTYRATPLQQLVRAVIHAFTFAGAYLIMLLAMYFNVYVIICILIGAGVGKFMCDWLVVSIDIEGSQPRAKGVEDSTVCCG